MSNETVTLQRTMGSVGRDPEGNHWTTFRLVGDGENTVQCAICGKLISHGWVQTGADRRVCDSHMLPLPPDSAPFDHP